MDVCVSSHFSKKLKTHFKTAAVIIQNVSPAAGVVTGGTIITTSASNLNWTQSVVCYFGNTVVRASYALNFKTASCRAPFSGRVSLPTIPLSVSIDGNAPVLFAQYYYYGMVF